MNSISCSSCGLINSPADPSCRRCGWPLGADAPAPYNDSRRSHSTYAAPAKPSRSTMGIVGSIVIMLAASAAGRYAYTFIRPSLFGGTVAWQTVSPPGAKYDAKLPGPMKAEQRALPTPIGNVTAYMYGSEVSGQGFAGVMNADYPIDNDLIVDDSAVLEGAVNGTITSTKSTLVSKRDVRLPEGYRGIEYELVPAKESGAEVFVGRVYWVPPRIYVMILMGKRDSQLWKERDLFLTSFALKK